MKFIIATILAVVAIAENNLHVLIENTAFGYLRNIGVPVAERIRKIEEETSNALSYRIEGGQPALLGAFPWQAGLLINFIGLEQQAVCGGSLITTSRIITAAHCWYDGVNQAWRFLVVLGSTALYSGGTRIKTTKVFPHARWVPILARNDIAIAYLPYSVTTSDAIAPIALPSGPELKENFVGEIAYATGFGRTSQKNNITSKQFLSFVGVPVVPNSVCRKAFPNLIRSTNLCTKGGGGIDLCSGDSGSPLVIIRKRRPILIGITSFGSKEDCKATSPTAFTRVTSFINFIRRHIISE